MSKEPKRPRLDCSTAGFHEFLGDRAESRYEFATLSEIAAFFRGSDCAEKSMVGASEANRDDFDAGLMACLGFTYRTWLITPHSIGENDQESRSIDFAQQLMRMRKWTC